MSSYVLGIDIGTSSIKVILVEKEGGSVSEVQSLPLPSKHAEVPDIPGAQERKVEDLLKCLDEVMGALDSSKLQAVCAIGVCGQMHGCVLWNDELHYPTVEPITAPSCSNLITWQDMRCTPDFLSSLPTTRQPMAVSAGYGCPTLAWLQRHRLREVEGFTRAGTIMDMVVWLLCSPLGESRMPVLMSAQNAASWGYFDIKRMQWETDLLSETIFPVRLLPRVIPAPSLVGSLHTSWHHIPQGTPACVGMGDLQCAFMAAKPSTSDAVLNVGSASQIGVIKPAEVTSGAPLQTKLPSSGVMEVPYFHTDSLLVAASLTGANIFSTLVRTLQEWMWDLNVEGIPSETQLYERLVSLAEDKPDTSLSIQVTLWGERHDPDQAGAVGNVTPRNLSMGDVSSAMFRGIVENLRTMMSEIFRSLQINRLLGSGSALQRNPALQHHVKTVFKLPLELREKVDAPLGAALAARELIVRTVAQ